MHGSLTASVRTSLVWQWAQIAVRHEAEAYEARAGGEVGNEELQASMVCIAATAFALDAIYAEHREVVPCEERNGWREQRTARWKQIFETLRRVFALRGVLRDEFKWLFERDELGRDFLVHPDAEFRDPVDHPLLPNTTAERGLLRAENATRAVNLLMEVLDVSLRARGPEAREWARRNTGVIEGLRVLREGLRGRPRPGAAIRCRYP
jgi:hypothetical protein